MLSTVDVVMFPILGKYRTPGRPARGLEVPVTPSATGRAYLDGGACHVPSTVAYRADHSKPMMSPLNTCLRDAAWFLELSARRTFSASLRM